MVSVEANDERRSGMLPLRHMSVPHAHLYCFPHILNPCQNKHGENGKLCGKGKKRSLTHL